MGFSLTCKRTLIYNLIHKIQKKTTNNKKKIGLLNMRMEKKILYFFVVFAFIYTGYLEKHQMNDINNSMPTKGCWYNWYI